MRVRLQVPSGAEATIHAVTQDGKEVKLREIFIEPIFFGSTSRPSVLYAETQDIKGNTIYKYIGTLGGTNGELKVEKRQPSVPKYDALRYGGTDAQFPDEEGEEYEDEVEESTKPDPPKAGK